MSVLSMFFVASLLNRNRRGEDAGRAHDLISSCEAASPVVSRNGHSDRLEVGVMDEELDRFKRYDLRLYAATLGFVIDKRESSRCSTVMRCGHEKVIISRKPGGIWSYWSPHDDEDRGTIIDLLQKRKGLNLGAVRKELREWTGTPSPAVVQLPELASVAKDFEAVRARYSAMRVAHHQPFLENERGIPAAALTHWRFAGTVRIDGYGAAVFPHHDAGGILCGYELKNVGGFTGFAPGGKKQIWLSNTSAVDVRLVICESAIDAMSHAALFDDPRVRYGSIAGKPTVAQHAAVRAAILAMPANSEIVAATDADESGRALAELIRTIVRECGRDDLTFRRDEPEEKDWNDVLRKRRRTTPLPHRHGEPSVT
jgi:hypothetical protein